MRSLPHNNHQWATVLAVLASLFYLSLTASAAEQTRIPGGLQGLGTPADFERFIDEVMADHFGRFALAGASIAVVKDGEVFFAKGYGHADVTAGLPVEADKTLFATGSVAKLFTWTAVMRLVEEGKLDLEAEVNSYLSAFKIPDTFPEPVRVWHLLSHTAGFEDKPIVGLFSRSSDNLPALEVALVRSMPARLWPPGLYTAYSNYSTALAAYIVAEVSGVSWEDYVETNLLQPLEMQRSSVRQPIPEALALDLTKVYGSKGGEPLESAYEFVPLAPAGGMVTTTRDMANFMIMHLQEGRFRDVRLLEEATTQRMHSQLFTHDPRLPGNAHGFWEVHANGQRILSHGGDTFLSHTMLAFLPEHDLGFYVAYNSAEGGQARGELVQALLDRLFPTEAPAAPEPLAGSQARLERLAGIYGVNRVSSTTLAKLGALLQALTITAEDGVLVTDLAGVEQHRWVEVGPLEFQNLEDDSRLLFQEDSGGRISHAFMSTAPMMAILPTAWQDTVAFQGTLLAMSLLLILSALVLWPILAFVQRRRGVKSSAGAGAARWVAAITGMLFLLFLGTFGLALRNPFEIAYGLSPLLSVSLILGIVTALLSVVVVALAVLAWRRGYWSMAGRLHYTLVALAAMALVWQMNYWNLLGFRV